MDRSWRLADIGRHLGVSKQRVHQLAGEGGLPAPSGEDQRGRYWNPAAIRAWARAWSKERSWRRVGGSDGGRRTGTK